MDTDPHADVESPSAAESMVEVLSADFVTDVICSDGKYKGVTTFLSPRALDMSTL